MSRRRRSHYHGLLPIFKEVGPTSHDVVDMARKALGERRIGHTGTLDPLAEGLLLLCIGQATRLQQYLLAWDKTYLGEVQLGRSTTTYDSEGEDHGPAGVPPQLDRTRLDGLEEQFRGEIQQVPPPYSAKKIAGKKMYELARSGESVTPEPKPVTVHEIALEVAGSDRLAVRARTSTGFYVRSLAHDIGVTLGCGGHLHRLHREAIGPYTVDCALTQAQLLASKGPEEIVDGPAWVPLEKVELPFPAVELNPAATQRFLHGQDVVVFQPRVEDGLAVDSRVVVRGPDKALLGIGSVRGVLARGRTLNIAPAMVLDIDHAISKTPKTRA